MTSGKQRTAKATSVLGLASYLKVVAKARAAAIVKDLVVALAKDTAAAMSMAMAKSHRNGKGIT